MQRAKINYASSLRPIREVDLGFIFRICLQTVGAAFAAKKVVVDGNTVTLGVWVSD